MAPPQLPPVDKLPLVVRKDLRDQYEAKKPEYESKMTELLGEPWTIQLEPKAIYPYVSDTYNDRLGTAITWYLDSFMTNLEKYVSEFGNDGKQELNTACSKHELHFGPQETTEFSYGGLVVENDILDLVFARDQFPVNVDDVSKDFAGALKKAPRKSGGGSAFGLTSRNAVRTDYDPKIGDLRSRIATLLNVADIKLNPNFEANAAMLAGSKDTYRDDWDTTIGWITFDYFQAFQEVLTNAGFEKDDMLHEGFQDAVDKKEVKLAVVPKEQSTFTYNGVRVDGGVLVLETTPDCWGVNIGEAAIKLLDVL